MFTSKNLVLALISVYSVVGSAADGDISNLQFRDFSKVTIKATKNGHTVNLNDILSARSPLRAKVTPPNCQDTDGLRQKVGTVFVASPDLEKLPLTVSFDFKKWTVGCEAEGSMFYLAMKEPSPSDIRKLGYEVDQKYETIYKINPEQIIILPDLRNLLSKTAKISVECRLYNNAVDKAGAFYGCVQTDISSTVDYFDIASKLEVNINIVDDKPVSVMKRFGKVHFEKGVAKKVTLYGSRAEANGIMKPTVKVEAMEYNQYLSRLVTIQSVNGPEDYLLTDK